MKSSIQREICLLLNLGGFETRMTENLEIALGLGKVLYSLTGDGLVKVEEGAHIVPVNVLSLSPAELLVWSSLINEQLQAEGFTVDDAIILAAGKKYRGSLPLARHRSRHYVGGLTHEDTIDCIQVVGRSIARRNSPCFWAGRTPSGYGKAQHGPAPSALISCRWSTVHPSVPKNDRSFGSVG